MLPLTVKEILTATKGSLMAGGSLEKIKSISTDSRSLKRDEFFIPLKGDNHDGHDYVRSALSGGASGFLTDRNLKDLNLRKDSLEDINIIKVNDTLNALQDLAAYIRGKLDITSVNITGSTGKTCTKDILKSILSNEFKTVATKKNYNNEIGVPLTLLEADLDTEVLIAELAMRGRGQIESLARITKPDIGIITNIGLTHFELVGSIKEIAFAKAELARSLPKQGTLFLNVDDPWSEYIAKKSKAEVIYYGLGNKAEIRAENVSIDEKGKPSFKLIIGREKIDVRLGIFGRHNIINSLAAAGASWKLGLNLDQIRFGIENAELTPLRMDVKLTNSGVIILNDTYNANPTSMSAALQSLIEIYPGKRKIAILGDMAELGSVSLISHKEIGSQVAKLGLDYLITIGSLSRAIFNEANTNGQRKFDSYHFNTKKEAFDALKNLIKKDDVVLVKASRSMEMEEIVNWLISHV